MSVYVRTLRYFRPFVWPTVFGLCAMLVAIGLHLLKPWPFKLIIDGILPTDELAGTASTREWLNHWLGDQTPAMLILWICVGLVVVHLLWGVANLIANYLFIKTGLKALLRLRTELYACLQSLPLQFHDSRRSTDSSFRVAYDSQSIQTIYNQGFATVLNAIITLVWAAILMAGINWKLTLASFLILPFVFGAIKYYAERIRRESTAIQERESDVLAVAQEGISSIRLVHAFGREKFEVRQFMARASQSLQANLRLNVTSVSSALVIGTLMAVGTAVMYYVGSNQVLAGELSLGDLVLFSAYLVMLYQPLEQLSYTAWALEGAAAGMQRCFEVLDREPEARDQRGATALKLAHGEIEFCNVGFAYKPGHPVLRDINLQIHPGETVAFVGGTGAGKSTLLSLALRFYDPSDGEICIDGQNIRNVTKKSLRENIGMVLQDTLLFSTTVRENIAYGRPSATEEEILDAARQAQAFDFIQALPEGFETEVGERGGHLSVGQRQRIGIARAFLKNAPILLLDEPTSALDPTTESAIMLTIEKLMEGRTTLIVTHRLATIHSIGKIAVLKNSTITEFATGPELLKLNGDYADLYRSANIG